MLPSHLHLIARCGHDMPGSREGTYKTTLNARQTENFLGYFFCQISSSNRFEGILIYLE